MKDYTLKKPEGIDLHMLHRMVAGVAQGQPHSWRDNGDSVLIRTAAELPVPGTDLPTVADGEMRLFKLRAAPSTQCKGSKSYFSQGDHASRKAWLVRKAAGLGFELLSVHCASRLVRVQDQKGRDFMMDSTEFHGALKVTDSVAFEKALQSGVGSTGRAFGFSLLVI